MILEVAPLFSRYPPRGGPSLKFEEKLKQGVVTVSTLSQVGSFLYQEKRQKNETYSKDEKLGLLSRVEGKSSRETTQILPGI